MLLAMDSLAKNDYFWADTLLEALEVAVHMILYLRGIYPSGIFKRCQKYQVNMMMSSHPDLNSYIKDVFDSIRPLILKGNMEKLIVHVISKEGMPMENFVFELKLQTQQVEDPCSFQLEAQLRALMLKLSCCDAMLQPLPSGCTFQILAYTNESSYDELAADQRFNKFPWVVSDISETKICSSVEESAIIPVRSCTTEVYQVKSTHASGLVDGKIRLPGWWCMFQRNDSWQPTEVIDILQCYVEQKKAVTGCS